MDRLIKRHPHLLARFLSALLHSLCVMILKGCRRNVVSKKGQLPSPGCTRIPGPRAIMKTNSKIFASEVAAALNNELGQTRAHIKLVAAWTGANERTVKNWFAGNYGPSGDHLVTLIRFITLTKHPPQADTGAASPVRGDGAPDGLITICRS